MSLIYLMSSVWVKMIEIVSYGMIKIIIHFFRFYVIEYRCDKIFLTFIKVKKN
jgi:hypothetical protein